MNLNNHIEKIKNFSWEQQTVRLKREKWLNGDIFDKIIRGKIGEVLEENSNELSRNKILAYFSEENIDFLKIFIASIIWGYGTDNRGPSRLSEMLEEKKSIEIINKVWEVLKNNGLEAAYKGLKKIPKLGTSFLTKYLYFLGKGLKITPYPLIFDARVAKGLCKLNSQDSELNSLFQVQPKNNFDSYMSYCELINEKAKEIKVEADKIEYFLFKMGQ